jgi:hypothetical protein
MTISSSFVEGDGILATIQGRRPQWDEYSFYTGGGSTLDSDDIEPVNIYAVIDVDVMWRGGEKAQGCTWWGYIWVPNCFGELSR